MYLFDVIESKAYDAAFFVLSKRAEHYDKKRAKQKAKEEALRARNDKVNKLVEKLNIESVPYTEDIDAFKKSIKNKVPAVRAMYNPANAKTHTYTAHYTDTDGSIGELTRTEKSGHINFVDIAMGNIDKYQAATSDLQRRTVTLEEGFIKGIENYDYKLLNDGSVVFVVV